MLSIAISSITGLVVGFTVTSYVTKVRHELASGRKMIETDERVKNDTTLKYIVIKTDMKKLTTSTYACTAFDYLVDVAIVRPYMSTTKKLQAKLLERIGGNDTTVTYDDAYCYIVMPIRRAV